MCKICFLTRLGRYQPSQNLRFLRQPEQPRRLRDLRAEAEAALEQTDHIARLCC